MAHGGNSTAWITAGVGLAGIAGTLMAGWQARRSAATSQRQEHAHQERMAREARIQQRRADAYVDMIESVNLIGQWAQMLRPMVEPSPKAPDLPSAQEQAHARALVAAFGSKRIRELYDAWHAAVGAIQAADYRIAIAQQMQQRWPGQTQADAAPVWEELEEKLRPAERAAREALITAANAELDDEAPRQPEGG